MNLICPHCQKPLSIPEDKAGQTMACPLCGQSFQVPALPQTAQLSFDYEELPDEIPLVPLPPNPDPVPETKSPQSVSSEDPIYKITPEPPKPAPAPTPPPRRDKPGPANAQQRGPAASTVKPPPASLPATGYERVYALHLRPEVVSWIAPVSLVLVFLLLWFPWVGAYPGGYGIYTQNAFQAVSGSHSTNPVGDQVMDKDRELEANTPGNWFLMPLYVLLVLVALALSVASIVSRSLRKPLTLPPAIERIWPWRTALVGALSALALLILLLLFLSGLSLENGVNAIVDQKLSKEAAVAKTGEEKQKVQIKYGLELGQYNLHRTSWLWWVVVFQLGAIAGAGLELWLEKRGSRPPPRIEAQW
jgi:hypothetical protein